MDGPLPVAAVTGATGFLGRFLVRALHRQGFRVRILARQDPVHPLFRDIPLEVVPGDLACAPALARLVSGATSVVHAAGLIKAASAGEFFAVNEGGAARVGAALAGHAAGARLVVVSSLAAREPELSPYAASKRAGEGAAVSAAATADWCIVRPPAVYGPWDRETLALFKAAAGPVVPVLGGPAARLALIQVEEAAAAVAALARPGGPAGTTFELADPRPAGYGWDDLLDAAAAAVGRRARRILLPKSGLHVLGRMGSLRARVTGRPVMLTVGKVREILHEDWSVQPDRMPPPGLWSPRLGLVEGFAATAAWYRERGWLAVI
ncbi:NAD-dependent epimerase/dehydratase family protein [Rhodospirillum centenum]|uniref:NAD dependent epimerase n=1 Tax=Rhodospirillum centenum (strain ATCC 51521 / SW) TaxID=414684 RepID=B6IRU1_RHOCS|nr:SDR family NAD(P)-dependent oxidoreductase [Rhodospirillum centenum]ACI98177.1 NAD dependent epimerase [Rhodospirillum centenum SW]